jgi:hypothetical protein
MSLLKMKPIGFIILSAALLTACGSDGDGDTPAVTHSLSGNVSGLTGSVTLNWADQQKTLDANSAFTVAGGIADNANITLSLSTPPTAQECAITSATTLSNVTANVTGVSIVCSDLVALNVSVKNYFTGDVIEGAEVNLAWEDNNIAMSRTATTDADGQVELYVAPFVGRMSVNADSENFGEYSSIINSDATTEELSSEVLLLPINGSATFAADDGANIAVDGVQVVDLPPASFINADGTAYSGDVDAEITFIDPSSDPDIMPGDYTTVDQTSGAVLPIQSFGAVNMTFTSESGDELNLADGETATIRIPVAEGVSNPPATIPLYYFDETMGRWIEEGEATLTTSGDTSVYEGSVSHFTTWNADIVYESVSIIGCVVDVDGVAVPNATVITSGSDYIGRAIVTADSDGQFSVRARRSSSVFLSAFSGTQSRTSTISTGSSDTTLDNCLVVDVAASTVTLTWGSNPSDLDTHFSGPAVEDASSLFHVYYGNKIVTLDGSTVYLDVDDTSSFGPEVLTVPTLPHTGTYRYSVHHYSGSSDIHASPARVELNVLGETSIFSPPEGTPTRCWAVFDLIVDDAGVTTVSPVNRWEEDDSNCDTPSDLTSNTTESRPTVTNSPFRKSIESKHYAK